MPAGLVARGVHWLLLSPAEEAAKPRRTLQQHLNDPPLLAFSAIPTGVGSRWGPRTCGLGLMFCGAGGGNALQGNRLLVVCARDVMGAVCCFCSPSGGRVGLRRAFSLSEGRVLHR